MVVLLWFSVACFGAEFGDVSPYVCSYYFSSVLVAEWRPFKKKLLIRVIICSLCILTICNISYFPFWFEGLDLGSYCLSCILFTFVCLIQDMDGDIISPLLPTNNTCKVF